MESLIRKIVEHHTKYIETHGVDETVFITTSEHARIDHRKLFPMVTAEQLAKISRDAQLRTSKHIEMILEKERQAKLRIPTDAQMREVTEKKGTI